MKLNGYMAMVFAVIVVGMCVVTCLGYTSEDHLFYIVTFILGIYAGTARAIYVNNKKGGSDDASD